MIPYNTIYMIQDNRFLEIMTALQEEAVKLQDFRLKDEIDKLYDTYSRMLDFAAKGMMDPNSSDIHEAIGCRLWEIDAKLQFLELCKDHHLHIYSYMTGKDVQIQLSEQRTALESVVAEIGSVQLLQQNPEKRHTVLQPLLARHQSLLDSLFIYGWANYNWAETDVREARELLNSTLLPVGDLCLFVSGVTLGISNVFDSRKYRFLVQAYLQDRPANDQLAAYLLIGIFVGLISNPSLIGSDASINRELRQLKKDKRADRILHEILHRFSLSWKTEEIQQIMTEEIIPTIVNSRTKFSNKNINLIDVDSIMEDNPDWMPEFNKIQDNIERMTKFQMEGYDTQAGTFSRLKGNAFFRHPAHWLYTFSDLVPEVHDFMYQHSSEDFKPVRQLLYSPIFCDSDRFSLMNMMTDFPLQDREMFLRQFSGNKGLPENFNPTDSKDNLSTQIGHYIHNLYRFIRYSKFNEGLNDLFNINLIENLSHSFWTEVISLSNSLYVGDLLIKDQYYLVACGVYECLSELDALALQKFGYCLEKNEDYATAIEVYEKANLMEPGNQWILKHLILSCIKEGNTQQAFEYIKELEQLTPDSPFVDFQKGEAYLQEEDYEEALECFFKVQFYSKPSDRLHRAIGWCFFQLGRYDDAINTYTKIDVPRRQTDDWFNLGHCYFCAGDLPLAIEHYAEAYKAYSSFKEFYTHFSQEMEQLHFEQAENSDSMILELLPDMVLKRIREKE